jgi:hypothetical protein
MDPVQQISIIPSGNALGYTLNPPAEDKYSVYKNELKEKISMLLGGRAAEEIIFGDVSGGASNDIERATAIAKKMVTQLGMSEALGLRAFGTGHSEVFLGKDFSSAQDYSDDTAAKIDAEIHDIITDAYNRSKQILNDNIDKLHFIAEFLIKNEIMDGEQFVAAMEGNPSFEDLEEMTEAKKRRSREENDKKRLEEKIAERKREEELRKSSEPDPFSPSFDAEDDEDGVEEPAEDLEEIPDDEFFDQVVLVIGDNLGENLIGNKAYLYQMFDTALIQKVSANVECEISEDFGGNIVCTVTVEDSDFYYEPENFQYFLCFEEGSIESDSVITLPLQVRIETKY